MSRKRRALSQLYQAKGVAPGTVDAVSDIIPFGQKPSCIPAKGHEDEDQLKLTVFNFNKAGQDKTRQGWDGQEHRE